MSITREAEKALEYAGKINAPEISVSWNTAVSLFGDGYADGITRSTDALHAVAGRVYVVLSPRGRERALSLSGTRLSTTQYRPEEKRIG